MRPLVHINLRYVIAGIEEEDDKTCSIEPTPPEELLKRETHLSVAQEAEVSFSFTVSDAEPLYLTNPEKVELIQIGKDG